MKTTAWPFGTDADEHDPLTALRIPVVNSFKPSWRYVAAYLNTAAPDAPDYLTGPPFASLARPTDSEAQMLASFLLEHRHYWFGNAGYARKMDARPLDIDSGWNTTVFVKYGEDDWGYGRVSWTSGHTFVPGPPSQRGTRYAHAKHPGPLPLDRVLDLVHTIGSNGPMQHWLDWKATHPEVFPA
ncbi:hypothetical protein ACIQ9J_01460 [Streptomyces sp. NPDC094153]|uniref:hypothetical protein n=1 Tax=Streptomyces sp. NPDC094153 TaxID=3366058 RepID=UPI0037FAF940